MAVFIQCVLVGKSHDTLGVLSSQVLWWLIPAPGYLEMQVELHPISGIGCTLSTPG